MANCRRFDTSLTGSDFNEFSFRLVNEKGYLPDVYRDYPAMLKKYEQVMCECCQPWAMVDSGNKLGGVFFIGDVVPGHKGNLYVWVWGKCFTPTTARFLNDYVEYCAESNRLDRVECQTPDERLGRMLELAFFKLEGRFRNGYKSGGKLSTLFQYRRLFSF